MTPDEALSAINGPEAVNPFKDAITISATLDCGHTTAVSWPTIRVAHCPTCPPDRRNARMVVKVEPVISKAILIAAGNTLYIFDHGDERADMQYMVCVASNLDTEKAVVPANRLSVLLERITDSSTEVIDLRNDL